MLTIFIIIDITLFNFNSIHDLVCPRVIIIMDGEEEIETYEDEALEVISLSDGEGPRVEGLYKIYESFLSLSLSPNRSRR